MTTLTVGPVLDAAGEAVTPFGGLILLAVGLSFGFFVVSYLIAKARSAKRG